MGKVLVRQQHDGGFFPLSASDNCAILGPLANSRCHCGGKTMEHQVHDSTLRKKDRQPPPTAQDPHRGGGSGLGLDTVARRVGRAGGRNWRAASPRPGIADPKRHAVVAKPMRHAANENAKANIDSEAQPRYRHAAAALVDCAGFHRGIARVCFCQQTIIMLY